MEAGREGTQAVSQGVPIRKAEGSQVTVKHMQKEKISKEFEKHVQGNQAA